METRLPVEEAAGRLGLAPQTLRVGLQQGRFPFGTAIKRPESSQYTYYINKAQFERWVNGEIA